TIRFFRSQFKYESARGAPQKAERAHQSFAALLATTPSSTASTSSLEAFGSNCRGYFSAGALAIHHFRCWSLSGEHDAARSPSKARTASMRQLKVFDDPVAAGGGSWSSNTPLSSSAKAMRMAATTSIGMADTFYRSSFVGCLRWQGSVSNERLRRFTESANGFRPTKMQILRAAKRYYHSSHPVRYHEKETHEPTSFLTDREDVHGKQLQRPESHRVRADTRRGAGVQGNQQGGGGGGGGGGAPKEDARATKQSPPGRKRGAGRADIEKKRAALASPSAAAFSRSDARRRPALYEDAGEQDDFDKTVRLLLSGETDPFERVTGGMLRRCWPTSPLGVGLGKGVERLGFTALHRAAQLVHERSVWKLAVAVWEVWGWELDAEAGRLGGVLGAEDMSRRSSASRGPAGWLSWLQRPKKNTKDKRDGAEE
ncbi:hypothetical protein DFJ73DRAFT_918771, partial [Zopfochytrium polystomum]